MPGNDKNQFLKTIEEIGEISRALLKDNQEGVVDGIGDVMVTLIILAEQRGTSIGECLHHAYMEIKDREGRTINGTFIKH
jgi:NTP pyrophosphatase (non-canonical NTP hydrolase)